MLTRILLVISLFTGLLSRSPANGQSLPPELVEARRRVAVLRAGLPAITEAAEYAANLMTRDSSFRFMIPTATDPGLALESTARAGGLADILDAKVGTSAGIVLLPVRSWSGGGMMAVSEFEEWTQQGRPVIMFGSVAGKPNLSLPRRLIDNGAVDGGRASAAMNDVVNMMALWTFYSEFVAAATRRGWQPGIYRSVLMLSGSAQNSVLHFRMPTGSMTVPLIPAGQLGGAYLDALDAMLTFATGAEHQLQVQRAADSLRAKRAAGARLFVSSCGHFLLADLPRDTVADAPFIPIDWRWDVPAKLRAASVRRNDAMLWFGYGGYDCPNIGVSQPFADAGLKVVVVSDRSPEPNAPGNSMAFVPLSWRLPDGVVQLPFSPGSMAPISSVEMALHWMWIRRLVQ